MSQVPHQKEKAGKKIDVNNEMILMRKDIKKAKSQAIQKLNRKAIALKKKKTKTEEQSNKNKERANRFAEEIKILRTERPDTIFKQIFDSDWTEEDFMKRFDISLKYRAYMRIAVIPFIKKKLAAIKQQVQEYSEDHEKKPEVKVKKPKEELSKTPYNANGGSLEATDQESCEEDEKEINALDEKAIDASDKKEKNENLDDNGTSDMDLILFKPNKIKEVIKKPVKEKKSDKNDNENQAQASSVLQEKVSDHLFDKYEEVKTEKKPKMLLSEIVKDSKNDDVTCFLENIGQGFRDSSDESSEGYEIDSDADDIEDDQTNDNEVDQFFLADDGADKMEEKPKLKISSQKVESKKFSRRGATSQFVSLSTSKKNKTNDDDEKPVVARNNMPSGQAKKKKKNRPGQRQRQLLSGTGSKNKGADRRNLKRNAKLDEKNFGGGDKKREKRDDVDDEKVHPSWQASQMKKQQCSIQEFQGKRIVFDDSD